MFQSTPPCWGRPDDLLNWRAAAAFQSTPPCWGRPCRKWSRCHEAAFQSTPPCWGRPRSGAGAGRPNSFNPRPRAGGDTDDENVGRTFDVSIHAPVLGATANNVVVVNSPVFQSTPPCWGRHRAGVGNRLFRRFNPRPRAGGDYIPVAVRVRPTVSIHAPVLGATVAGVVSVRFTKFQSTPPCWGRRLPRHCRKRIEGFQSTPPCWGRPGRKAFSCATRLFQSTPPCWGRPSQGRLGSGLRGFNPRPRAGGDPSALSNSKWTECFNPRPRAGGD